MSTTSLKLPEDLKERAVAAAKQRGISTHAFMLAAIGRATLAVEQHAAMVADANAARKTLLRSGKGYDADQVHAYLRRRIAKGTATRPKAKSWHG